MVHGLSTWWSDAVGGSFLELHVTAPSLIGGAAGSLLMMVVSIWLGVRKLERLTPRAMLAGALEEAPASSGVAQRARRPRIVAVSSAGLAALLAVVAATVEDAPAVWVFFGVGALLLVASLAFFRVTLLRQAAGAISGQGVVPLAKLGARNGRRYPNPQRALGRAGRQRHVRDCRGRPQPPRRDNTRAVTELGRRRFSVHRRIRPAGLPRSVGVRGRRGRRTDGRYSLCAPSRGKMRAASICTGPQSRPCWERAPV